jgi:hypothetical protein
MLGASGKPSEKGNAMKDIELFTELVDVYEAVEEAIGEVRNDLAGLGMTDAESCPLLAFTVYDTAVAGIAELIEDAGQVLALVAEGRGAASAYRSLDDLVAEYREELDEIGEQFEEFFELLDFDIEEVLVDMPPLNRERADDEDAILYAAFDLEEMTEPWRRLFLLAQRHIEEKLEYIEALMTRFLELLQVEGYETEDEQ